MYKIPVSPYSKIFYNEWKLDQNRSDYNIVFDQELDGALNVVRLKNAIKRFIEDYLLFNSHIKQENGELYWVKNNKVFW